MNPTARTIASRISLSLLGLGVAATAIAAEPVRYEVKFERTWSSDTHPADFPLLAHFSPVIGVTHNGQFEPFQNGGVASPGVEMLCEQGKHQPLDAEIRSAIEAGKAGALIETADPLRSVPGVATASFEIDDRHPMVSIGAMIAPSPDWCAVAADVSLFENGAWVASKTVALAAWDSGTDSATSYRALDADMQPRGKVMPSDSAYFANGGQQRPVGSVTFTRK